MDRRSVRLRFHNYRGGLYFVTICAWGRRPLFGEVTDGVMRRSDLGQIAHDEWVRTGDVRPDVMLGAFVVMPDHVHLLFGIAESDSHVGHDDCRRGIPTVCPYPDGSVRRFGEIQAGTVASIMRQYKSLVTKQVWREHSRETGPVWQRGYHDRVVRTDREADALRRYIAENPTRWAHRAPDRRDGHRI